MELVAAVNVFLTNNGTATLAIRLPVIPFILFLPHLAMASDRLDLFDHHGRHQGYAVKQYIRLDLFDSRIDRQGSESIGETAPASALSAPGWPAYPNHH